MCREYEVIDRKLSSMPSRLDSEYFSEFSNNKNIKEKCRLKTIYYIFIKNTIILCETICVRK